MRTNKDVFSDEEFGVWAAKGRCGLNVPEEYLLKKYLSDRHGAVLEAGTGSGRIAFNIEKMGFRKITAFDFVPKMVRQAKEYAAASNSSVDFLVADAVWLDHLKSQSFDYAIYLQQVISFVPPNRISRALAEAWRVLRGGGIAIFSFCCFEGRRYNRLLSSAVTFVRMLRGEHQPKQCLPRLKLRRRWNWRFLSSDQATVYWFRKLEILEQLREVGFDILEHKTTKEICGSNGSGDGLLYVVCRKPEALQKVKMVPAFDTMVPAAFDQAVPASTEVRV